MNPPYSWLSDSKRLGALFAVVGSFALGGWIGHSWAQRNTVSAIVPVVIEEAGMEFLARLDTGSTVSSINAVDVEILDDGRRPRRDQIGKTARFVLINHDGRRAQVEAPIVEVRGIQSADCRELRYHVYLTVVFERDAYRVLMNLNDRSNSRDKLLLGRNWLRHGFVVDVSRS